jgi:hypothetical protein
MFFIKMPQKGAAFVQNIDIGCYITFILYRYR